MLLQQKEEWFGVTSTITYEFGLVLVDPCVIDEIPMETLYTYQIFLIFFFIGPWHILPLIIVCTYHLLYRNQLDFSHFKGCVVFRKKELEKYLEKKYQK